MGKLQNAVGSFTEGVESSYTNSAFNKTVGSTIGATTDVINVAQNAVLLTLSKKWIGIGMLNPAETEKINVDPKKANVWQSKPYNGVHEARTPFHNRFDYTKLWSLQLGEYFMPLSQTFTLRAKKRLNVSSLVDGIDIIQQTRKEAKTIDCTLRISLNTNNDRQTNLKIVNAQYEVQQLAQFLSDLYESDAVFKIDNETVNDTFGVTNVIMTEYKFLPKTGSGTYTFEFSLMEVKEGDNVLTFDLRQIRDAEQTQTTEQ